MVLKDVEEKAASFCQAAIDTPLEDQGRKAFEWTVGLGSIVLQEEADRTLKTLMAQARGYCDLLPSEIRELICAQIKGAEAAGSLEKGIAISSALSAMATFAQTMKNSAEEKQKFMDYHMVQIVTKLKEIDFRVIRIGLQYSKTASSSLEMVDRIKNIEDQLRMLASLRQELELLEGNMDTLDQFLKRDLQDRDQDMDEIVQCLEKIIKEIPDKAYLLRELEKTKEHMFWKVASRASALASIISLL